MTLFVKGRRGFRSLPLLFLGLVSACFAPSRAGAAETFKFLSPPSSPATVIYHTTSNKGVTMNVEALNSGVFDGSFTDIVTVGVYDTATSQVSDPRAIFVPNGASPVTGCPLPMTFVNGMLDFSVTFSTGSNSEQVSIWDSSLSYGDSYPGSIGVTTGAGLTVQGYSVPYYLDLLNETTGIPQSYPPNSDTLIPNNPTVWMAEDDMYVTINASSTGVTGASCFAVTGVSGGYAAGNQAISQVFSLSKSNYSSNPNVYWEIILDYNQVANGPLTDYNNPRSCDTVWAGTATNLFVGSSSHYSGVTYMSGPTFQPYMTNGQVIVRVWSDDPFNPILMNYASSSGQYFSTVQVPYSPSNVQPLQGAILSPTLALDGSVTNLQYAVTNLYNSPISYFGIVIPPNDPATGSDWGINPASLNLPGHPGSLSVVEPSGSAPGTLFFNAAASLPLTVNEANVINMSVTCSSQTNSVWQFPITFAVASSGVSAPFQSSSAVVGTLGIPSSPLTFNAVPINLNTGGNAVSIAWSPVTDQSPIGYILSRAPTVAGLPVTLPLSTLSYTDNAVTNLNAYNYSVVAYNAITQSAPITVGPVTAFANPAVPQNVQALSAATSVLLSWTEPASISGSFALAGYQVYRSASSDGEGGSPLTTVLGGATSITDTGLSSGTNYYYKVSAIDNQYVSGSPGGADDSSLSNTEGSGYPPGNPPTGLAYNLLIGTGVTIQAYWTAPTNNLNNPVSYIVYRAPNGVGFSPYTVVGAASTTINDSLVTIGTFYAYQVAGLDALGVTTNLSTVLNGYILPSAPTGLTASPSLPAAGSVTLNWTAVTGEGPILNYKLYRDGNLVASPASNGPVTDTPSFGVTHLYTVSAVNTGGEGPQSAPITTAILPNIPTGLSLAVSATVRTDVLLTWATPVPAEQDLTQYNLYRGTSVTFSAASPLTLGLTLPVTAYTDASPTTAAAGTTYYYFLQAQNVGGVGTAEVQSIEMPPNPPMGLGAASSTNSVTLTWTANPGGEAVTAYQVYRDASPLTFVAGGAVSTFTDSSGITSGVNHIYNLVAWNVGGYSLSSGAVTVALLPAAPSGLSVLAVGAGLNNVQVLWSASGAATNLTGYNLYRNTTPVTTGMSPVSLAIPPAGAGSPITDTTAFSAGATLYYFLQAQNLSGAGPLTLQGLQLPLQAPTVGATSDSSFVHLNWLNNVPPIAAVTFYTIYRGTSPTAVTQVMGKVSGQTSFDDGAVTSGVNYYYQITDTDPGAVSAPGWESLMSNQVTIGLVPQTPTLMGITLDTSNDVTFSWKPVTIVDPDAQGVSIYVNGSGVTSLAPTVSSFTDPALSPDTVYTFNLSVTNAYGQGLTAAAPLTILTYPTTVTLSPVALAADGITRIVTWTPTSMPADVTEYNVYRGEDANTPVKVATIPVTSLALPVTLNGLHYDVGHYYVFEITAQNATGEGAFSNAQTINVAPSAPGGVTAVSGLSPSVIETNLNWTANNPSEQVVSYNVYRSTTNVLANYSPVASGLVTVGYLDNSGLVGNTLYYYLITAVDAGAVESVLSTANAVPVTAYSSPNIPTGVNTFPGNASVTLTWTPPSVTTYPIAGYDLYRSTSAGVTGIQVGSLIAGNAVTDTALNNGVTYYYSLQTQDSLGHLSAFAPQTFAQPVAPPGPPLAISVQASDQAVQLTWNQALPGTLPVSYYQVFELNISGSVTNIYSVPASLTGYVDINLTNSQAYAFWMQTVDNSGVTTSLHVSDPTAPVTVTPAIGLVNPPSQISAQSGVGQVVLKWTDSFHGAGVTVSSYNLYRNGVLLSSPVTGSSPYTDSTAVNGTSYAYYFVANAVVTVSANSATVYGTPARAPAAPSTLAETDGTTSAALGWNPVAPTDNVPVTDYVISRAPAFGTPVTVLSPGVSFVDSGLTAGSTYIYNWTSYNANGTPSTLSAPVSAFPYNLGQPVLSSNSSPTGVTLTWTPPASSYAVSVYNVLRSTSVTFGAPLTVLTSASVSFLDTTGTFGQLYNYEIQAVDIHGHLSAPSSLVRDGTSNPPPAPSPVLTLSGNTQIVVDWAPVKAPIGGLPVSFYIVNRSDGASVTLPATQTWYLDSPVVNGTPVTYTVQTLDASGETTGAHLSAASVTVTAQGSALAINPPNSVAATATGPSTIVLSWTPSNDMGQNIVSYQVYRGTAFSAMSAVTTLVNPLTSSVTQFVDTGLNYNTTYYYVVQAINSAGTHSANSNHGIATTTTPTVIPPPPLVTYQMVFDANLVRPLLGQTLNISYLVPNSGAIEIRIYNITGNLMRTLNPGPAVGDVQQTTSWDIKDKNGNYVASGIYLIEIRASGFHQMKKVAVVK